MGVWEPETFQALDRFLTPQHAYLDVGAWIGPTVLYAAHVARVSYAFEPDPVARAELEANVAANAALGVRVVGRAVSSAPGPVRIGPRGRAGNSMSSSLAADAPGAWDAETVQLDRFVAAEGLDDGPIFLKVDIEGGEYDLLPSLRRWLKARQVDLHLSLHPHVLAAALERQVPEGRARRALWRRNARLVAGLPSGYRLYTEAGERLSRWQLLRRAMRGKGFSVVVSRRWPATP